VLAGLRSLLLLAMTAVLASAAGCRQFTYAPDRASRPYPAHLPQGETVRVQVLSNGITIDVVNATSTTYRDVDLWLNRRFCRFLPRLGAGESITLRLDTFWDDVGEGPQVGGFFATREHTPIVLAEIQVDETSPLVGLIAVEVVAEPF
jgi:hypothetical protein